MSVPLRVGVIFGGVSGEHDISLLTARGVLGAIDRTRYDVVPIGIARSGAWAVGGEVLERLSRNARVDRDRGRGGTGRDQDGADCARDGTDRDRDRPAPGASRLDAMSGALAALSREGLDVVFPLLHGPMGEDGTLQGLLEFCGVPYVGCGVAASAVAMDKGLAKDVFRAHSIPTLPSTVVRRGDWRAQPEATLADIESKYSYPLFVKPANLGSSVGISRAGKRRKLVEALDLAAKYDTRLLVEPAIDAREIEVGILGNSSPQASVPGEIRPHREFYDYQAKYFDDATELIVPAVLDSGMERALQSMAVRSFEALACAGLARVDFLVEKGAGRIYVSELNTMPGFTRSSMYPRLWAGSGVGYRDLIDRLIGLAME